MGHFCWMCRRSRPNEAFSGGNHGRHLCRECARIPYEERERTNRLRNLWSILRRQSVISRKNMRMAVEWSTDEDSQLAELAQIVAEVGRVHPGRKHRLSFIESRHPALWARMVAAGVVDDHRSEYSPYDEAGDEDEIPF